MSSWFGRGTDAIRPYTAKSAWDQHWWDGCAAGVFCTWIAGLIVVALFALAR